MLLRRIARREADIAIPVFDRAADLARAGADIVAAETQIILVEGNYLLLDEPGWRDLRMQFDLAIYLDVPAGELERRLVRAGCITDMTRRSSPTHARQRPAHAMRVVEKRLAADLVIADAW